MTTHRERKALPYSADEMYALVADIERYPEFLPWCRTLRIKSRREEKGITELTADMTIAFKVVSEAFTTRVTLDPAQKRIDVAYINGPFRYLNNRWLFEPRVDGGCVIDFFIDFEFKSRTLQFLIGSVFHIAVEKLVTAFEMRARALHVQPKPTGIRTQNA